jgi:iron complex transport system substrate-binding protein
MGREVEIPLSPQRIVTHYYGAEMVALGIPIIATNYANAQVVMTEEQLAGIEESGGEDGQPNMEKILTLDPDLIIMPDFMEESVLDELSQIAPTVTVAYRDDTFTHLRTLADLVGQPELAENWIEGYLAKVEQKRSEAAPFIEPGETASAFILYFDKKLYLYGPQRLGPTMVDAFGFAMPSKVAELFEGSDALWEEISLEVLPDYVGDRIFVVTDEHEAGQEFANEVMNSALWQGLPAVQNGKAYIVGTRWGLNDPLTLDWLLDEMAALLTQQ